MQSGTVPVERFWSQLKSMLPPGTKKVTLRYFRVLMLLVFLPYHYVHFTEGSLPPSAERDALLGQRLETVAAICQALPETDEHLQPLFDPFLEQVVTVGHVA